MGGWLLQNKNHFFGHNGYRVLNRASVLSNDIIFGKAWGSCNEYLFRWTLWEADRNRCEAGKFFYYFLITASSYRSFTYVEGLHRFFAKGFVVWARSGPICGLHNR